MPMPFQRITKRPALRRILLPFTVALTIVGIVGFSVAGM